jgi:hypothetical protein
MKNIGLLIIFSKDSYRLPITRGNEIDSFNYFLINKKPTLASILVESKLFTFRRPREALNKSIEQSLT